VHATRAPMSEQLRRVFATTITVALAVVVLWGIVVGEAPQRDRVSALGSRIKCPVCQGESIVDSPAGFARDMIAFVGEKIDEGWTDEEILTYLEERFPGTRLDPGLTGTNLFLWAVPAAAAAAGIALLTNRTQRRGSVDDAATPESSDATIGDTT